MSVDQSVKQWASRWVSESLNQWASQWVNQSVSQLFSQSAGQSVCESVSELVSQSVSTHTRKVKYTHEKSEEHTREKWSTHTRKVKYTHEKSEVHTREKWLHFRTKWQGADNVLAHLHCPKHVRTGRVFYLHVGPVKFDTLGGELVNVGSNHVAFSITPQLGPEVVHHQEQHVGTGRHCGSKSVSLVFTEMVDFYSAARKVQPLCSADASYSSWITPRPRNPSSHSVM